MNQQQFSPRSFNILPPVVKNLLIINVLVFAAQFTAETVFNVKLSDYLGMHYWGSSKFNPVQLVTYMFLHGSPGHIFFNMFALWMFGNTLENVWGGKRFLIYYMVTGVGAALIHMAIMWIGIAGIQSDIQQVMMSPTPQAFTEFLTNHFPGYEGSLYEFITAWTKSPKDPAAISQASSYMNDLLNIKMDVTTIGASGAVFGILLAFGMIFPNARLYMLFVPFPIKAKYFVMGYGALELILGVVDRAGDNVAHFAHLGGMIFGFILIKLWNKKIERYN